MKTTMLSRCGVLHGLRLNVRAILMFALITLSACHGRGQLAITEVMAYSSLISGQSSSRPDFWELTNFGDEPLFLDGYRFHDSDPGLEIWEPFVGVTIRGGESIILCRTNTVLPSPAAFVAWWGAENVPADLQVLPFLRPGFDDFIGDEIWLLDASSEVVDMVGFGPSVRGRTKTYDSTSGQFDRNSEPGVNRAFSSALSPTDIGSPGWTTGPVPVFILRQPVSQTVDCCESVTFSIEAGGIPRPTYQWTSNNIPLPDATGPVLTLPVVNAASGGSFRVILTSAGAQTVSDPAILTVNTAPTRPSFVVSLEDDALFPGQSFTLAPSIRGYPIPNYQWFSNGVALVGATNARLTIATSFATPLGVVDYAVVLSNALGRAESSARISVMRRPTLQITEVMPDPTNSTALPPPGLKPWFEVTNADTDAVNLKGYRFRDSPSVSKATIITNNLILQPGESIVFVDSMSDESFVRWWGDDRLPRGLQVVTWFGWSLSSRADDIIYLWNAHPMDPNDIVANTSYKPARSGFSQEPQLFCDEFQGCVGWDPLDSLAGVNGAFVSLVATNVGSPGFVDFPDPYFTRVTRTANTLQLRCRFASGRRYRLHARDRLDAAGVWTTVQTVTATNIVMTLQVPLPASATRFYRLEELP